MVRLHAPAALGLSSLVGLVVGVLALIIVVGVVGVFVILVVSNRAEPDPNGRRPFTVYLFGVSFVTLWTSVLGSVVVVSSLVQLIGSHPNVTARALHPVGDAVARNATLGGLVLVVSLALLLPHLRKGLAYARADGPTSAASRRVAQSYVAAVAFVAFLLFLAAMVLAIYSICQIAGPGVFDASGGRIPPGRHLIDAGYAALVALMVLFSHRQLVAPGIEVLGSGSSQESPPQF